MASLGDDVPSADVADMAETTHAANYPRRPRWRRGTLKTRLSDAELAKLEDVLHHASNAWHTWLYNECLDIGIGDSFEKLGMGIVEIDIESMTNAQQRQFYELIIAENARSQLSV